jgi:hypothetical protein
MSLEYIFIEKLIVDRLVNKCLAFMEPESSFSNSEPV